MVTRAPSGAAVLRLITRLNIGGPARQALLLSRALADTYPTVLAAGRAPRHEGELTDPAVHVRRVPLVRRVDPLTDASALIAVRRLVRDVSPQLVHTHMAKAGAVGRVAVRSLGADVRTVHTFHGHVLEGYFRPTIQRSFVALERWLAERTDALVAVSPEVRDSLLELGIGSPQRWHVIPLGFDLSPLLSIRERSGALRRSLHLQEDVPLVGVLGRLAVVKDHKTLLRAIVDLKGVHLAVLGDGELRPALARESRALGIGDRVHLCGWWADLASALADLDVVALTSKNEGTPASLIEASAAGLPVVGTNVGGVPSIVDDTITGFLTAVGDSTAIAMSIDRLVRDPELRRSMGAKGRAHVKKRFSKERLVADIKGLYDELLARRGPPERMQS